MHLLQRWIRQAVFDVPALPNATPAMSEANWAALEDGTIDMIGSDHAPHTPEEAEKAQRTKTFFSVVGSYSLVRLIGRPLFLTGVLDWKAQP